MLKAYKYRIYPTEDQRVLFEKTFGICRLVYNLALQVKIEAYKSKGISLSAFDLINQLVELKDEYPWMKEVNSQALQASIRRIDVAYKSFFRGNGFPQFKKKSGSQSFICPSNVRIVDFDRSLLTIPKIKDIPIVISRRFVGEVKTVTISRTPTNKYFASILVDNGVLAATKSPVAKEGSIGIDLGIKSFIVSSDGKVFEPNRYLKNNLSRLQCLQRRASRKRENGKNRKKANFIVAKLHEKIKNHRLDYIHKITSELIHDNQVDTYVMEDLNIVGMMQNRKLSQAISDVSWGEFLRQMRYKCDWYGKNLIQIGTFEPSSKMCSNCRGINESLTLSDRLWTCDQCGCLHDRDVNAAKNILNIGLNNYSGAGSSGEPVELRRKRRAKKQEIIIPTSLQADITF